MDGVWRHESSASSRRRCRRSSSLSTSRRLKVLVKLRAGDALLFDPLEPHCLTEAYYEPGTSAGARLWRTPLSLFTKKAHIKWGASKTDAAAGRLEPKTEAAAGRLEPDSSN